ncbi:hypothetical protein NLI96_g12595 [Meripilus lineatus]|uniref:Uncharacterized protein n=1 Tax=Meripilus lineatus TaxID=2056292 RepID=A0AAD5UQY2_9APHY|nr:hypothetical protein NLI96_g12595 [Physisporinus lineatus]
MLSKLCKEIMLNSKSGEQLASVFALAKHDDSVNILNRDSLHLAPFPQSIKTDYPEVTYWDFETWKPVMKAQKEEKTYTLQPSASSKQDKTQII